MNKYFNEIIKIGRKRNVQAFIKMHQNQIKFFKTEKRINLLKI